MDHEQQLEFDFSDAELNSSKIQGRVVDFNQFLISKKRYEHELERARLVADVVKSVQHLTGRSPDAEAL